MELPEHAAALFIIKHWRAILIPKIQFRIYDLHIMRQSFKMILMNARSQYSHMY